MRGARRVRRRGCCRGLRIKALGEHRGASHRGGRSRTANASCLKLRPPSRSGSSASGVGARKARAPGARVPFAYTCRLSVSLRIAHMRMRATPLGIEALFRT